MKFGHLKEGDIVYVKERWQRQHEEPRSVEVTKVVARSKGFYVGHARYDMETGTRTNTGSYSSDKCWLSLQEYRDALAREVAWFRLRNVLGYHPPKGMTIERIRELEAELTGKEVSA